MVLENENRSTVLKKGIHGEAVGALNIVETAVGALNESLQLVLSAFISGIRITEITDLYGGDKGLPT